MVGHTGSIPAVTNAVEVTDECLGAVVDATHARAASAWSWPTMGTPR